MRKSNDWAWGLATVLAPVIAGIIAVVFTLVLKGFIDEKKLADRPYVDDRFTESKHYTDEKSAQVLKEAFEHSDMSQQATLLKIEQMNTETKSVQSELQTKVDLVLDTVQKMRDEAWVSRHPRK